MSAADAPTSPLAVSYSTNVVAGAHQIGIDMRRSWFAATGSAPSPYQYLDNIVLTGSAVPAPISLNIQSGGPAVILTWTNAGYILQAAPSPSGAYTNVPGTASPYTNAISDPARYFRLTTD
jgi:hypothetical protein